MAFPGNIYAPPGVYTKTKHESPTQAPFSGVRIPVFIGTGSEILTQEDLELIRGSSSLVDQQIMSEDVTGRAVVSISQSGSITLGDFDGSLDRIRVKNYPIVTGDGSGTTATKTSAVSVTINGSPVVVLSITGATGVLKLAVAPEAGDEVRVTYYFNRTDTRVTDDVSAQVTPTAPVLYGLVGESYIVTEDVNDEFVVTVDEEEVTITLPASSSGWTASQIVSYINSGASGTSLVASTYVTNHGETAVRLTADENIVVGAGSANSTLGFTNGQNTSRNKVFYVFQRPIVDGSNGGITTTNPADVSVTVDNVAVTPTAVDGQSGAVTLPTAPPVGSTVAITYYFNSWQDTFDYLAHINVTEVTRCGATPDRRDYVEGSDFVLQDDKILWGTAVAISSGEHTDGYEFFDDTQIGATLVDTRQYMAECSAVTTTSGGVAVTSQTQFTLPLVPTTGNGRNSPLGSSTFQTVSNSRIDLPTNRPDLVTAYWGFSLQDAIDRGSVTVTKVDSSTRVITLQEAVPVGASVYATFYYNTLADQTYSVQVVTPGAAGVGTYTVLDENENTLYTPQFGTKSAGLAGITVQFPSGTERQPDVRFEVPFTTSSYVGPVAETVTVTFASKDSTLGKYTVPESGPYYMITGASDHIRLTVDGAALAPAAAGIDLSNIMGVGDLGFHAQMVGDEVSYDADSGYTTYEIDSTNREVNLTVDGVLLQGSANSSASGTLAAYVTAINEAATGHQGTAQAGAPTTVTLAATASDIDDYYVGWTIQFTNDSPAGTLGDSYTITAYNGTTKVATCSAFTTAPDGTTTYWVYNPDNFPQYKSATRFTSAVTITAGEYDDLTVHYTGDVSGASGNLVATIAPGTYSSATTLATAVNAALNTALAGVNWDVVVTADSESRLVFTLIKDYTDEVGFLEFITDAAPAEDFAILAGIDTDSATGGDQTKLVDGPIARRITLTGDNTSALLWDRIVLRNRIVPGSGSIDPQANVDQATFTIEGSSGYENMGLSVNEVAYGGWKATVQAATMAGFVGWADGQVAAATYGDARDGQPVVTFYAAGGTTAQNNVFKFTFDGTPVTVEFTDAAGAAIASGASADVPLGPAGTANTVINQIAVAMATAGIAASAAAAIAAGYIRQEGAGIRFRSASYVEAVSSIVIGTGSANDTLGFSDGQSAVSTPVTPEVLVSALMGHAGASVSVCLMDTWQAAGPSATYFAEEALAKVVRDDSNAAYLFLQSQGTAGAGTSSSIAFDTATADDVINPLVGLGVEDGDGGVGEAGLSGFYVTSSDTVDGSGTANTSLFNSGNGQDGTVGQTYRDLVTGLTFTILPREGGSNYPDGTTVTFTVASTVTTDSNLPVNTIPGLELIVSNTLGIAATDTGLVETFERGGSEPTIGDVYYATYNYTKQDFSTKLFTKFGAVEAEYGANGTDNPVTLAAYLAILNGAVLVAVKQVEKDVDEDNDGVFDSASIDAFTAAVDDIEGLLPGGGSLDILVPLDVPSTSTATFLQYLARHCDIQSNIRYRAERTAIAGLPSGTTPTAAGAVAEAVKRDRMRIVYPDIATVKLTDAVGAEEELLVDGSYIASALAGSIVAPTKDVATPWTGMKLFGFASLARVLDAVEMNQVAVRGVTVLEDRTNYLLVRHGLTTDMTNILTKLPTIKQIADEVQKQSRAALERFTGIKFLPGVLSQIEGQLATTLKLLVDAEILTAYTGVEANVASDDPTVAEVTAYYQPVFPLLYLVVTFNLRSSL